MAGQEAWHLRSAIGGFVTVDCIDGKRRWATLVGIRANGCRVRYSDGKERTVAAWRISKGVSFFS